ncbi:glycerol-3-phosphate 1-O-acyltransferase PlsY [Flocculibacter collagenilyticus]|uniref:glycerol-3-phosphate 1-O-acyltransferase PlsY n=1 Tax=Flocculibacter collagenilyticus TaxID=2744479 RepID=UPI0018F418E9|nr:glycerol-3-phosphate 1-O-acyltransferase PlsY [Flocculibacter collagenilyticus]
MIILTILMIVAAYLIGSISSAVLLSKLLSFPDPRVNGSGNPGATNVYRLAGKIPAIMVLVFDILKGTIPVWLAYFLNIEPVFLGVIAIAACLGHIFPLFFGFKGGKAVATAFGTLLPIGLDLAGLLILTWLITLLLFRYSSLAAIITVSLAPVFTYFIKPTYTLPVIMLATLIVIRHKENIIRLIKNEEARIVGKNFLNRK